MRSTEEIRTLTGAAFATHYMIVGVLIVPAMSAAWIGLVRDDVVGIYAFWISGIFTILTLLVVCRQRHILRFVYIETSHSAGHNYEQVFRTIKSNGWRVVNARPNFTIEALVTGFPDSMLSWGESVVVRFEGSRVYVNSICDPDQLPSVTAWGRNKRNVALIRSAVVYNQAEGS